MFLGGQRCPKFATTHLLGKATLSEPRESAVQPMHIHKFHDNRIWQPAAEGGIASGGLRRGVALASAPSAIGLLESGLNSRDGGGWTIKGGAGLAREVLKQQGSLLKDGPMRRRSTATRQRPAVNSQFFVQ